MPSGSPAPAHLRHRCIASLELAMDVGHSCVLAPTFIPNTVDPAWTRQAATSPWPPAAARLNGRRSFLVVASSAAPTSAPPSLGSRISWPVHNYQPIKLIPMAPSSDLALVARRSQRRCLPARTTCLCSISHGAPLKLAR
ncbi:hypothetical protein Zm00014a_010203 [Zea mays]|uniref:Uncharacterized protein n=1 Tax=Zea mays TaxID=4577 RepID=A0A317Y6D7_MAIZE|nr:hypothetical protein Zm00014a_010203 [Zea mays]